MTVKHCQETESSLMDRIRLSISFILSWDTSWEALGARELIKITVLKNCLDDGRSIADVLAERTHSQVVQVIGRKIVLYRPAKDEAKRKIVLPK